MCGIFGTINYSAHEQWEAIVNGLFHRGPDEQDFKKIDNVELYHTRLAIQELSPAGSQPMVHNGIYIVFNGEIYNHLELRKKYNLRSESHSDTHTILLLYKLIGMSMLDEFDGMFAFALYDSNKNQVYLARDRAGKKPLYYYRKGEQLVFSSELNTLYRVVRPEIDKERVAAYLYRNDRTNTPYKNVQELESGALLQLDIPSNELTVKRWWKIEDYYLQKNTVNFKDALQQTDEYLQTAVKRRIVSSDLDVGAFLSGGIDSGLVTAIAAKQSPKLRTFTVRIEGAYDESALALQVANKYATDHTVVDISFSELQNDIETILFNYGEPFADSSAIPSYYVAKAAKEHITVVLNGDGADELFGGYRRYVPFKNFDFFNSNSFVRAAANALTAVLPVANEKKSKYNYIYRLLKFAGYSDPVQIYSSATGDLMVGFEKEFIQMPKFPDFETLIQRVKHMPISSLKKILLLDFETILFGGLLPKMDIATMAHSLEGRSPFLSRELLEYAPQLDDSFKINKTTTKYLLRELARQYLPPDLINQPKRGFEIPLKSWVDGTLNEIIRDYLHSPHALYKDYINKSFIDNLLSRKVMISDERRAKILYCVFCMEVWYKNLPKLTYASTSPLIETV